MDQVIKPDCVNFKDLVTNNANNLSLNLTSEVVQELEQNFTNEEQKWYVAQLYMYLNFHPTDDYPVNLEDIYKIIGFANKGNAKRTLENNFTKNEDYKIIILPSEKKQNAGRPDETIMLNTDTFKSLCMITKTEKAKDIRKYYVKLENIYNKIITKQLEEKNKLVESQKVLLTEQQKTINNLKNQEQLYLYIGYNPNIQDIYKIGITTEILIREEQHKSSNPNFTYLFTFKTDNAKEIETMIKLILKPYKTVKPEWYKNISYEKMKKVVDFCIMMYDEYKIHESLDNLIQFIARYKSNTLITANKARTVLNKDIYTKYIEENVIFGENFKVARIQLCDDFVDWYSKSEFKDDFKMNEMLKSAKIETGNWSHSFLKEIMFEFESRTKIKPTKITIHDTKRGFHFPGYVGFVGFELKSMRDIKNVYYKKEIYEQYATENLEVTHYNKHKLTRVELVDDFTKWIRKSHFQENLDTYCQKEFTYIFKQELMKNISEITGIRFSDKCSKSGHKSGFIGIRHNTVV